MAQRVTKPSKPSKQGVLQSALKLSLSDRATLVDDLIVSLYPAARAKLGPELRAELDRRWREYKNGKAKAYTWAEVKKRVRAKYETKN